MGTAYRCDPQSALAVNVYEGDITMSEFIEHLSCKVHDPAWLATTKGIVDASAARLANPTEADLVEIEALFRSGDSVSRQAALIGGQSWETFHAVEALSDRLFGSAIVFNEVTAACGWLGVDEKVVKAMIAELRAELRPGR